MSNRGGGGGGLTVLDGSLLRGAVDLSLPDHLGSTITGAQVIELAESRASDCLQGTSLPESLKNAARNRMAAPEAVALSGIELDRERASKVHEEYMTAIADQLDDDPVVVSILNGSAIHLYLEDEDDFALLAENLFTELDVEDKGKIRKKETQAALDRMGIEIGIPPTSEIPLLNDILKKHGAEGEEEVGQAQFAHLLQPVLQELADNLSKKPVIITHNVKVANGSKIRQFLENEKQLDNITEKIWQSHPEGSDERGSVESVRTYLEKSGKELGFPPLEVDESAALYDSVVDVAAKGATGKDEFRELVKGTLENLAEQLDANPVFYEPGN